VDLAVRVGRRLREMREARGTSLSELARRSTVGRGTLSELESGRRNPPLETLYALATALGVPLSTVLDDPSFGTEVRGEAVDAVLTERFEAEGCVTEIYRVRIRAGTAQESAAHTPGTVEQLIVLAGTARVGGLSAPALIGPGGHGSRAADVPHVYQAPAGDVEALLVVRHPH
jgi:transcriptional regulator with XRE-family HTH domain